jgi:hypothetical protein
MENVLTFVKALLLALILWFIASTQLHSMTKLYLGEEDGGMIAGVETKIRIADYGYIGYEIKSLGLTKAVQGVGFSPTQVLYTFRAGTDTIEYRHDCLHNLDQYAPANTYVTDRIDLKFKL